MKRLTISLPEELLDRLHNEAAGQGISLDALMRNRLSEETDPLLQVAGISSGGTLTTDLDKDLYELES